MLEATGLMVFYGICSPSTTEHPMRGEPDRGGVRRQQCGKSTLMYTLSGIMEDIKKKEEMGRRGAHHRGRTHSLQGRRHLGPEAQPAGQERAHPLP